MLNNFDQKKWLVYQVGTFEMGSEGWSSMHHVCVAEGNTPKEVIENYVENVRLLYGYELNPKLVGENIWWDYYRIAMTEIKTSVFGNVESYCVGLNYSEHKRKDVQIVQTEIRH